MRLSLKPVQPLNAAGFIEVTELGIVKPPVNPEHMKNAPSPIVVTDSGITRFPENSVHLTKLYAPIVVTAYLFPDSSSATSGIGSCPEIGFPAAE